MTTSSDARFSVHRKLKRCPGDPVSEATTTEEEVEASASSPPQARIMAGGGGGQRSEKLAPYFENGFQPSLQAIRVGQAGKDFQPFKIYTHL